MKVLICPHPAPGTLPTPHQIRTFILPSWLLPLWPNRLTPRDRWNRLLVRRLPHSLRFTMLSAQGMCNPSSPWVSRDRSVSLRSTFLTTGASGVCRTERWRPATETRVNDERHLTTDGQSDDEKWVTAVPLANDERNPSLTKETWHS